MCAERPQRATSHCTHPQGLVRPTGRSRKRPGQSARARDDLWRSSLTRTATWAVHTRRKEYCCVPPAPYWGRVHPRTQSRAITLPPLPDCKGHSPLQAQRLLSLHPAPLALRSMQGNQLGMAAQGILYPAGLALMCGYIIIPSYISASHSGDSKLMRFSAAFWCLRRGPMIRVEGRGFTQRRERLHDTRA